MTWAAGLVREKLANGGACNAFMLNRAFAR